MVLAILHFVSRNLFLFFLTSGSRPTFAQILYSSNIWVRAIHSRDVVATGLSVASGYLMEELKLHRSEGDINLSPARVAWQDSYLNSRTRALLADDSKYFLHQALSTPCLNALEACYVGPLRTL